MPESDAGPHESAASSALPHLSTSPSIGHHSNHQAGAQFDSADRQADPARLSLV